MAAHTLGQGPIALSPSPTTRLAGNSGLVRSHYLEKVISGGMNDKMMSRDEYA